jgi:hypothetical protein
MSVRIRMGMPLVWRASTARLRSRLVKANTHRSKEEEADRMWPRRRVKEVLMLWGKGQGQGLEGGMGKEGGKRKNGRGKEEGKMMGTGEDDGGQRRGG